jgi:hypothetical protein
MSDSKEKLGNAINQLDLLHRLFINHGNYGGSFRALGIRDDLLVVWRGMEDPPPKLPWPGEDASYNLGLSYILVPFGTIYY